MFRVENLSLSYPRQEHKLLREINITLQPGELLWLKGHNGSGKTSLLNAISGIIPQHIKAVLEGSVSLNGKDLAAIPLNEKFRWLSYQMSDPDSQIFFPRVEKELSFGLENLGLPVSEIRERIASSMTTFGLECFLQREPSTLSQGEKKLLILATCAALDVPLILLDEPSAGLSAAATGKLVLWLKESLGKDKIIIVAEHNAMFGELATQTLDLDR